MIVSSECVSVLSIDAWRSPNGWDWNSWSRMGTVPLATSKLNNRALLKMLRDNDFLGEGSCGKVAVEDDGYNTVIVARGTREPLIALAYGEAQA